MAEVTNLTDEMVLILSGTRSGKARPAERLALVRCPVVNLATALFESLGSGMVRRIPSAVCVAGLPLRLQ